MERQKEMGTRYRTAAKDVLTLHIYIYIYYDLFYAILLSI
jgi:hypothetical protein